LSTQVTKAKKYYQRCLNTSRKFGFLWAIGNSTKYLGQVALLERNAAEAEMYFLQSLKIAYDLSLERDIANHLYELARLRVAQNRSAEALEFLVLLLQHPASEQAYFGRGRIRDSAQELLTKLENDLSPETYIAAVERGKELRLGETIHNLVSPLGSSWLAY
jgi:tetratricopeptide (TPR) repeat protein